MKAGWKRFTLLVAAGKLARYAAVAYLTIRVAGQQ
jgi:membrane protein YqaA with SNARE-associated domain